MGPLWGRCLTELNRCRLIPWGSGVAYSPNARTRDIELVGNLNWSNTVGQELADFVGLGACGQGTTFVLAFSLRLGNPFALAFEHHTSLELSNASENVEHEFPRCRRRVQVHGEDTKGSAFGFDPCDDVQEMGHGPRYSIQLRDDDHVTVTGVVEAGLELVTLGYGRDLLGEDFLATDCNEVQQFSL